MSLEDSIGTLLSYSLVKRNGKNDSFSIHPLVHSWARLYLASKAERETEIARRAFGILRWAIDVPGQKSTDDWNFEKRVMLHTNTVAKHMNRFLELGNVSVEDGALTTNLGNVYKAHGQYDKALKFYERALAGREQSLGVDHPSTLTTVDKMASVFKRQGQYDKALKYYERALAGREKSLGVDHPSTLSTVKNMALVFDRQGDYDKALKYYERAFLGKCSRLGWNHPRTKKSHQALVKLYKKTGRPLATWICPPLESSSKVYITIFYLCFSARRSSFYKCLFFGSLLTVC